MLSISTGSFQPSHQVLCMCHFYNILTVFHSFIYVHCSISISLDTPCPFISISFIFTLSPLPPPPPAGLSGTNVLLYSFGFIFSVVVFPIGLVLWMLSCCRVFSQESDDSSRTCYSSPHNSTSESESVCSTLYSCI